MSIPLLPGSDDGTKVVNPEIEIEIVGVDRTLVVSGLDVEYDITKDLEQEPNYAQIYIYNLNRSNRDFVIDPSVQECPITVSLSKAGSSTLVKAFSGEIERVSNYRENPGWETILECSTEKEQSQNRHINAKTYKQGTPMSTIAKDLVDAIGLPQYGSYVVPPTPILFSQSFSGPAFPILRRFLWDLGAYAFILDGKLIISDIWEPTNPNVIEIQKSELLSPPIPSQHTEADTVELYTAADMAGKYTPSPFKKTKKKRKKKMTTEDLLTPAAITEDPTLATAMSYEVVDSQVNGMEFELRNNPNIQPDDIVSVATTMAEDPKIFGKRYRVRSVNHFGNQKQGSTALETTEYDITAADPTFLAQLGL